MGNVAADGDLEQMVYYVVSDLSARWGYHGLLQDECCGGTQRELNVFLFYRDGQAPAANLVYNTELVATLPDKYRPPALEDIDVGSSGINGNGRVNFMRVMYDEMDPMHRLSVIVHEYYHVVQIQQCGGGQEPEEFSMWLAEGGAMATENLYLDFYFRADGDSTDTTGAVNSYYNDQLFSDVWGAVASTIANHADGSFSMGAALEAYSGATMNYQAEATAFLYLAHRTSLEYAIVDFVNTGACNPKPFGSKDAAFAQAFGTGSDFGTGWSDLQDFYEDFNAWLATSPNPADLKPTEAQLRAVFGHSELCSDLCATANDGVCDAECLHGSDCSDCGVTSKPDDFPVAMRAPYDGGTV